MDAAKRRGYTNDRDYVSGTWMTHNDTMSIVCTHSNQDQAMRVGLLENLNVAFIPNGVELHEYTSPTYDKEHAPDEF